MLKKVAAIPCASFSTFAIWQGNTFYRSAFSAISGGVSRLPPVFLLLLGLCSPVLAQQALERNLPPAPQVPGTRLAIEEPRAGEASDEPLGVDVRGIRLLGPKDQVGGNVPSGVSFGALEGISHIELEKVLQPFLGKPLSNALLEKLRSDLVLVYRRAGYPFVAIALPPQEVTKGLLQVQIVEFTLSSVNVEGGSGRTKKYIASRISIEPGGRLYSPRLEEDLEWLNRSPYRRVAGEFRPGKEPGTSELGLTVTETKPWQFVAGWSNSGSQDSGTSRYFMGGGFWVPRLNGMTFSYQMTGGEDVLKSPNLIPLNDRNRPTYLSHSGRLVLPTFSRQALEIAPNFVATHQQANIFIAFDNDTFELPIIYRSAVSNIIPGVNLGDVHAGVEFKTSTRKTTFVGIPVGEGTADLFQITAGWSLRLADRLGSTHLDLGMKANPGGVLGYNTSFAWNRFTGGRVTDITYVYGSFDIQRITNLPAGFSLRHQFNGVVANQPLPDIERLGLGGMYAVRGYVLEDATVDTGFILRNELRLPAFTPLATAGVGLSDQFSPYVFADLAYGRSIRPQDHEVLASVGLGFDYDLNSRINVNFSAGYALINSTVTKGGDWTAQARISFNY
jgi:hemolysin activation/secretion protein